jgi:hypothetical protein
VVEDRLELLLQQSGDCGLRHPVCHNGHSVNGQEILPTGGQ